MLKDTVPFDLPIAIGEVVDGKYRIDGRLGVGGMGTVLAATHLQLDQRVALKLLSSEVSASSEAMARFHREAQVSVRIRSEFVARTIDIGALPTGTPYIVMEYLEGQDISERLQQRGPLPIEQSVEFVLQACEAVADAHALGIVHRDLKPSNLFVVTRSDGSEAIKVLDFGISKVMPGTETGGSFGSMTRTSTLMGSPVYMSPEQMTSARNVDGRTDIWALGVTLFEMLTGKPPFEATSLPELCSKVLTQPAPALRDRLPDAPPALESVLRRAMEKDPDRRYTSIARFSSALAPFAPETARPTAERISRILIAAGLSDAVAESVSDPAPVDVSHEPAAAMSVSTNTTGGVPAGVASDGTIASWSHTRRSSPNRWWAFGAVGGIVLVSGVAGIWWMNAQHARAAGDAAAQISDTATDQPATDQAAPEQAATHETATASGPAPSVGIEPQASAAASASSAPPGAEPEPTSAGTTQQRGAPIAAPAAAPVSKPTPMALPTSRHGAQSPGSQQLPSDRVGARQTVQPRKSGDSLMVDRK